MNRAQLWKASIIAFVIAFALYSLYPPGARDILEVFQERSSRQRRDGAFTNILEQARSLQAQHPERGFANLRDAVGTNDLTRYFPTIDVKGERNPTSHILNRIQQAASGKIKLGLDLRGGTSFLVVMDTNALAGSEMRDTALANAVEVLRKRVDKLGVAEPLIQPSGTDRILIQLPGLSEADMASARRQIEKAAFLEFRMVHPESPVLISQGLIEPGYDLLKEERRLPNGSKELVPYIVSRKPERGLTGKYVKRAFVTREQFSNEPEIDFELDGEGAKLFAEITREYSPKDTAEGKRFFQLAIILDGELYSAPRILGEIPGGRGRITGSFDIREAVELANVLENPLEAPVKIVEERTVDPSLGHDSIRSGVVATIVGSISTFVFMVVFYFFGGLIANVALALNILILMGVMCSLGSTLTLPGIAGIALTIGMAVDANVLIFERMREEMKSGKSLRGLIAAGYDKAFGTIFDSNLTTLIASLILFWMGTGPVQGFGITLSIGICASMFTALLITRFIYELLLDRGWLKSVRMLPVVKITNLPFMEWSKVLFICSWLVALIGLGYGIHRGRDVLGVDFAGGDVLKMSFKQRVEVDKLRDVVGTLGVGDCLIQFQKNITDKSETLQIVSAFDTGRKVEEALKQQFPEAGFDMLGVEKVGASVGKEIQRSAIIASLLALFGILVYVAFRYELSFAVAAVVALMHDVAFTLALFCLSGRQFGAPMVAAILTIIGYSVNDKIVILDRIREDLKLGVRGTFKDLINLALNQTLSRTIITGGAVILATLALLVFGGGVINDFAFTFLVGILIGTYSSLFIASPLVLWWHKGERPRSAAQVAIETAAPQGAVKA
jgi:SecD/SecF fusion protein